MASNANPERRKAVRYPVERGVHYKVFSSVGSEIEGTGTSLNISSSGVLFTTDQALPVGSSIEVAVSWLAMLTLEANLWLVAIGRVVRSDKGTAAMKISQYELRTLKQTL